MKNKINQSSLILKNQKGFTLTELLIVMAIIGMIGTFAAGQFMSKFAKAKVDSTKIQIRNLGQVLDNYKLDCGVYPSTEQTLSALIEKPTSGRECKNYDPNGYLKDKKVPKDGFGNDFVYESDTNSYVLISLGNDGAAGGTETNADIKSDDM